MSSVIYKTKIIPGNTKPGTKSYEEYTTPLVIENVLEFSDEEFEKLNNPDPKAARSMSRAALLMTDVGMSAQSHIDGVIQKNPFRVAMYAVIDNGPDDYSSLFSTADLSDEAFPQAYKKSRSPKQYLKQLPNVAPAQIGIFLGLMGSTNVFVHTQHGVLQALEQAEVDLRTGVADLAMVISAFSLEDALLARRYQLLGKPETTLSEGAACLILGPGSDLTDWRSKIKSLKNIESFGIATNLVNLIKEGKI
jgi:3-oxoacyl-(acyl-carrier-protein) synthase